MISFENPQFVVFLLLAIIAVLFYFTYRKWINKTLQKLASPENRASLLKGFSLSQIKIRFLLLLIGLVFISLALINLRKGSGTEISDRKGLDIVFALDVSKSMLATDMQPNRLDKSKVFIQQVLKKLQGDRAGLIVFAGKAYLQTPITSDYNSVQMMLETTSPEQIPVPGTVLGEAIDLSRRSFNQATNKYKVLVLISDGEDHDNTALAMAEQAKKEGVHIFTIGVGSPNGTTLIDPNTNQVRKDEQGNDIITKLNEEELKGIAATGDGTYFLLNNLGQVSDLLTQEINKLEKRNQGTVVFTQYKSYFQWFLFVALISLLLEGLWRRNK